MCGWRSIMGEIDVWLALDHGRCLVVGAGATRRLAQKRHRNAQMFVERSWV
jgi:hypothetical protein